MAQDVHRLLDELKKGLQQIYGDRLRGVYLFGSYARGEEDGESDVDVAVILNDFESYWEEIKRTRHLVSMLSLRYGVSLSTVKIKECTWREDDFPLYINLRREGIPI